VGKIKEPWLVKGIQEYQKRLSRYSRLQILEVAEIPAPAGASAAEEEQVMTREGAQILDLLPSRAFCLALDRQGKTLDSLGIASLIEEQACRGCSEFCFIIGGSLGLSSEIIKRADMVLSFSALTFPHQLMRLFLLEQVYRAFKIRAGETYHK
jgi:23S rRNA (pseudouridine1915-N3)-methyltransferase